MTVRIKLIEQDGQQFLPIPADLTISATEVFVRREEGRLLVEPVMATDMGSFFQWLQTIEPWAGPGPDADDPLPEPVDP